LQVQRSIQRLLSRIWAWRAPLADQVVAVAEPVAMAAIHGETHFGQHSDAS